MKTVMLLLTFTYLVALMQPADEGERCLWPLLSQAFLLYKTATERFGIKASHGLTEISTEHASTPLIPVLKAWEAGGGWGNQWGLCKMAFTLSKKSNQITFCQ